MPGHLLVYVNVKACRVFIVYAVPNLLIAVRALSPNTLFILFDDKLRELHRLSHWFEKSIRKRNYPRET